MPAAAAPTTRPYLRADARRRQLLDAAVRVFTRSGYPGLTMVAVADEAGASRRLVYDHFADLPSLQSALFDEVAARHLAAIDQAVAASDDEPTSAFAAAFDHLLAMPGAERRLVTALVADVGTPGVDALRRRFRDRVERRWAGAVAEGGADQETARAVTWMAATALIQLVGLVDRGEITAGIARPLALALAADLPAIAAAAAPTDPPARS